MAAPEQIIELHVRISANQLERFQARATLDPISYAKYILSALRRRQAAFPRLKGHDPGWAILLDLLVQSSRNRLVSVNSACLASGAPLTTGLRHLEALAARGDVVRSADTVDGRRTYVRLSDAAKTRLLDFLETELQVLGIA